MRSDLDRLTEWTHFILNVTFPFSPSDEHRRSWYRAVASAPPLGDTKELVKDEESGQEVILWRKGGRRSGADSILSNRLAIAGGPHVLYDDWWNHTQVVVPAFQEIVHVEAKEIEQIEIGARFSMPFEGNTYQAITDACLASSPLAELFSDDMMWDAEMKIAAHSRGEYPGDRVVSIKSNQTRQEIMAGNLDEEDNRIRILIGAGRDSEDIAGGDFAEEARECLTAVRDSWLEQAVPRFVLPFAPSEQ